MPKCLYLMDRVHRAVHTDLRNLGTVVNGGLVLRA
jgi:hypothetical protein